MSFVLSSSYLRRCYNWEHLGDAFALQLRFSGSRCRWFRKAKRIFQRPALGFKISWALSVPSRLCFRGAGVRAGTRGNCIDGGERGLGRVADTMFFECLGSGCVEGRNCRVLYSPVVILFSGIFLDDTGLLLAGCGLIVGSIVLLERSKPGGMLC